MGYILLGLYFSSLMAFSFVSHPVSYCVLLILSALSVTGYVYLLIGFSWYLVLFCLVYIGGVYVLFIFVSVHSPNPSPSLGGRALMFFFSFVVFSCLFGARQASLPSVGESSYYLCRYFEGLSYCLFCLVLMVGFVAIRIVVGEKDSFFR